MTTYSEQQIVDQLTRIKQQLHAIERWQCAINEQMKRLQAQKPRHCSQDATKDGKQA